MASSIDALNRAYNATAGTVTHLSLHTGDPGATGANEVTGGTYARVARGYGPPTAGAGNITSSATFDIPSGTTVSHWGAWDGSTFLFGRDLDVPQTFATDGTYTLISATFYAMDAF